MTARHLLGAICAVATCATLAGLCFVWACFGPTPLALLFRSVTVPDLEGTAYGEDVPGRGFAVTVEYRYDPQSPAGTVLHQSPAAGSIRRSLPWKGCPLTLTVSLGPERVPVPDCTGLSRRDAALVLQNLGFAVSEARRISTEASEGQVLATTPAAGETPTRGSTVQLTVSAGDGVRRYTVPDLCGRTDSAARALLKRAGLTVGRIVYIRSDAVAGTVLEQSLPAGKALTEQTRTAIRLTVSGRPYYNVPQVPDLHGMTLQQARAALDAVGLSVGALHRLSFLWNDGTVVTQSPPAGTYIAAGLDRVDLYLAE
jgi:serine/threonine-protein kinase